MAALVLADEAATRRLGARLARLLAAGDVVALAGDLGTGKSLLARACLQALAGAPIPVPSPTFTLVQTYAFVALEVWHVDLYRLAPGAEVEELGLGEALDDAALLIEWPDRLPPGAFPDRLTIDLAHRDDGSARTATLTAGATWRARLQTLLADMAAGDA